MDLYKIEANGLEPVQSDQFKLEREIQSLVESNMESLFELKMITSEFSVGDFRLDSLCFDEETNSFVIVEYKRGSSYSVIDQGYSYLSVMLNNKAEFILEYNEKFDTPLKRSEVDWSSSRVVFVSPSFNTYQRNSVNFKDVPFELWEIKRFDGGLVMLEEIRSSSDESVENVTGPNKTGVISDVSKEVITYREEDHVSKSNLHIANIWSEIRSIFEDLASVHIFSTKYYVGMKRDSKVFAYIEFKKTHLFVDFNRGNYKTDGSRSRNFFDLEDPKEMAVEKSWTYKSGVIGSSYRIKVQNTSEIKYVVDLINQKYESLG
jgi:hypothetical protein